jgi:hypothetical protein
MKEIWKAIIAVMTEINGVAKNMTVWTGSNAYQWVSDRDVKEAIRESMIKNGLSILPTNIESKIQVDRWEEVDQYSKSTPKDMKTKQSVFTEVTTRYILLHSSGESIEVSGYWQWVDSQDKWAGKATTYALKNTLLNMFLVPTWVDTDNTHSDDHPVPKKEKPNWETYPDDDDKEWFNYSNWEAFKLIDHKFTDPTEAIKKARKFYAVSKKWALKIEHFYRTGDDKPLDSF